MSSAPTWRAGWYWSFEGPPSKCRHFLPVNQDHDLSNTCKCKPEIQNQTETGETIVIHKAL